MAIEYPYSEQAERATLGTMMVDEDSLKIALSSLVEDDFYVPNNRLIFRCMNHLSQRQLPVDITTITDDLVSMNKLEEIGGVSALVDLCEGVVTTNSEYYIGILKEKKNLRDLLDLINRVVKDFSDSNIGDSSEYLDDLEKKVVEIARNRKIGDFETSESVLSKIYEKFRSSINKKVTTGVPSGFGDLDKITNGFQKGDMVVLAARTSMGKTALALNFALNAARDTKQPIAIFSLEMPAEQLVKRMISTSSYLESDKLRDFKLNNEDLIKFQDGIKKIGSYEIYIDDTPAARLIDIQSKARKLKSQRDNLAMIVVDYLGMITLQGKSKPENRVQEVSELSRGIKAMARELNVPVICLAQLSRNVEKRGGDKRPMLSDLRESGAIEQDADVVLFIYRDDYYDHSEDAKKKESVPAELIIAKHRNGATGMVKLVFTKKYGEFRSMTYRDEGSKN